MSGQLVCTICAKPIVGAWKCTENPKRYYHAACFKCTKCSGEIRAFFEKNSDLFCSVECMRSYSVQPSGPPQTKSAGSKRPPTGYPGKKVGGATGGSKRPPTGYPGKKVGGATGGSKRPPTGYPGKKVGGATGGSKRPPTGYPGKKVGGATGGSKRPPTGYPGKKVGGATSAGGAAGPAMFCPSCGNKNTQGANFCPNCGARMT
eukprot:TRINITY_DN1873_c0_g1_i1.p1 TRINITY_DN1873_c0_g1~~TRINITY_DN1873_c0_g1_i1.p1  ORF type:complete len:204 (+),score=21.43 TRINITY_DN1873_c0_g1_i1:51-662(+)